MGIDAYTITKLYDYDICVNIQHIILLFAIWFSTLWSPIGVKGHVMFSKTGTYNNYDGNWCMSKSISSELYILHDIVFNPRCALSQ